MLNQVRDREIQPFYQLAGNQLICEMRKTPTVLYGIFTELVRQFWMCDPKERLFGTPPIRWDKDVNKTDMWIDTELRWEAGHPEVRPAIYVSLSQIQHSTVGGSTSALVHRDIQEAENHYARVAEGSVSFVHVAATAGEACILADATMDYLDAFSPVITDDFCFDWFNLVGREPLQVSAKDSNEKYTSTVTYNFRFTDAWSLKHETPKLRDFKVKAVDAVVKRIEVGEYWDFMPKDGGLVIPENLTEHIS